MRAFFVVVLSFLLVLEVHAQALPKPERFQQAVGEIVRDAGVRRGFAANDPRIHSTNYGVGRAAVATAGGAGAGLLIAGTAPAWITVLGVAAATWAVGTLLDIAYDGVVQWAFSPDGVSYQGAASGEAFPPLHGGAAGFKSECNGGPSWVYGSSQGAVAQGCVATLAAYDPSTAYSVSVGGDGAYYLHARFCYDPVNFPNWCVTSAAALAMSTATVPSGTNCASGAGTTGGCITFSPSSPDSGSGTIDDAIAALPASELEKPVSHQAMADFINEMSQQAASQPDYAGMPMPVSQPLVEAADVARWAQANPEAYPRVADALAPVGSPNPGLYPSAAPSPGAAPQPAISPTPDTAINPAGAQPQQNLGPDPGIGSPTLEATPTAAQILAPILDLFPDFRSYSVPSHASECPRPGLELFGQELVLDAHCTLLDTPAVRDTLYAVMAAVWLVVAVFIILTA